MAIHSKIGIIGGGISGIAAAKQLSKHEPMVFESTDSIGGVWKHCSYKSTKLQTPRCDYEFSDFPWTQRDNTSFPSYQEILDYLYSYATYFDVLKFVRFNSKVVEIRFVGGDSSETTSEEYGSLLPGKPVWEVGVQTSQSEIIQWYAFEFLVICTGKYGDVPAIPKFPKNKGPEIFHGKVMHTIDYCKLNEDESTQLLKGKKVVIFGYKKSAIDLAVECAEANQVWGLPFYMFYSTRASQFLHERPNQGLFRTVLCHMLSPMLPLEKYGLKPDHPFEEDYASCQMAILPEQFFPEADKGKIAFKRASKWWFTEEGVEFEDGTKLDADIVILATGFDGKKKLKAMIPDPFRTEIRCKWLSRLVDEQFKLPSVENMLGQTAKEMEIMRRTTRFYKRSCISTFSINHSDEICEEMGWSSWRKKNNWFAEAFSPYNSQDYEEEK
ncbi:hypothetical protein ACJIZ3_021502 [Penstemon smallii]|uniref:Flavin-containing monooxygenase n=1 Tax=Penstemon smallii TaxID=265156 RepID=A0ABD3SLS0_9LAMI